MVWQNIKRVRRQDLGPRKVHRKTEIEMRKKTREGKGAVNNEMWNISGGKRGPCCGYGSEKVMSKGHYLQLLKRKYKFIYKEKVRKTKI